MSENPEWHYGRTSPGKARSLASSIRFLSFVVSMSEEFALDCSFAITRAENSSALADFSTTRDKHRTGSSCPVVLRCSPSGPSPSYFGTFEVVVASFLGLLDG
eukprot:4446088-Amphidinium_carterae.3